MGISFVSTSYFEYPVNEFAIAIILHFKYNGTVRLPKWVMPTFYFVDTTPKYLRLVSFFYINRSITIINKIIMIKRIPSLFIT